jgi:isoleucyl-tRNA synthetase
VTLSGSNPALEEGRAYLDALRELLNVSQLEVQYTPNASGENKTFTVQVHKAHGKKCERCWHWETDVGEESKHPTLCGRCVEAVNTAGAK